MDWTHPPITSPATPKAWLPFLALLLTVVLLPLVAAQARPEAPGPGSPAAPATSDYPVVDTGQVKCYSATSEIACPAASAAFYGQDAQHAGNQPHYTLSTDGLTVYDHVTELTWQHTPDINGDGAINIDDKLTWTQAQARPAALNAANYGGYSDWRLPAIKELYSLIDFRGTDPSGVLTDTTGLIPFIDTDYFQFAYGDTSAGERIIDSQYASSSLYVASAAKLFGVNFADGRIKGYDLTMPGGAAKVFLVQCVRGNANYGANGFVANGDGTVTDSATGLMWAQADSGAAMNWQNALAWVQAQNAANYLGHDDWRLPDAKELQSLVDYTRSPDTSGSAAIDPLFRVTAITNEAGAADYPFYWASTTHAAFDGSGAAGVYVAFGRAGGWMKATPGATCYTLYDVHGAGAQRSDPKSGNVTSYYLGVACSGGSAYGRGPQGDVVRIANYVRPARDAGTAQATPTPTGTATGTPQPPTHTPTATASPPGDHRAYLPYIACQ